MKKTRFCPNLCPNNCPNNPVFTLQKPSFQRGFTAAKTPFQPCSRPPDPRRCPHHLSPRKSPQNRPFTAILRAKYNLITPQLNFCNKKRASSPSKIKPKFNFWYSLFYIGNQAKIVVNNCFSAISCLLVCLCA